MDLFADSRGSRVGFSIASYALVQILLQKWLARAQCDDLAAGSKLIPLLSAPGDILGRMSSFLALDF